MKTLRLIGFGLFAVLLSFAMASCDPDPDPDSDPDPTPDEKTLTISGLDSPFSAQEGNFQTAQELKIESNTKWYITGKPSWLDISQVEGSGNATVKVWPNIANTSSEDRSATLSVKAGDIVKEKTIIQSGKNPTPSSGEIQGHKYVDLGLSVKWADRNIGAKSPEHFGDYFAWGETEPKSNYSISNYKWNNGDETDFTKYCINSKYGYNGFTDDKTILDKEDDAAYINWGDKWRMPTQIELVELIYNCKWEWTTSNNVNGYLVTGLNGNSIFLPAAGRLTRTNLINAGTCGEYWLSNLTEYDTYVGAFQGAPYGSELYFCYNEYNPEGIYELSEYYREYGLTIRPVVSEN